MAEEQEKKGERRGRRICRKNMEHRIQCACVRWFRLCYPKLALRLFAVPNGGRRDATTGRKLKEEGVLAGVADLVLLKRTRKYGALLVEMKTGDKHSMQSPSQKEWETDLCRDGEYKYIVCRSFEEFEAAVTDYLKEV